MFLVFRMPPLDWQLGTPIPNPDDIRTPPLVTPIAPPVPYLPGFGSTTPLDQSGALANVSHDSADPVVSAETGHEATVPQTGTLSGTPTSIPPLSDSATTRSLIRENESAIILASGGYNVVQNSVTASRKNPDYLVNGEIFDNYSPDTANVRNIASAIERKIVAGQTSNVVVNLKDSAVTPAELQHQLSNYPISGLDKIIVIDRFGKVIQF